MHREHAMHMRAAEAVAVADLRTYLRRRRDDRPAPEYLRYIVAVEPDPTRTRRGVTPGAEPRPLTDEERRRDPGLPGLRAGVPARPDDEGDVRRIRRDGQPWCPWLGNRVSVALDLDLQALFAAWEVEDDPAVWHRAYADARSDAGAARTLRRLRIEGRRLVRAARERASASPGDGAGRPRRRPLPRPSGGPLQDLLAPSFG